MGVISVMVVINSSIFHIVFSVENDVKLGEFKNFLLLVGWLGFYSISTFVGYLTPILIQIISSISNSSFWYEYTV